MDCCTIGIISITGSCCFLCICMYCIQSNYFNDCCNRRCFCFCPPSQVSNMPTELVIEQPGLPKYGEEVIYNGDMVVDENYPPPPEYLP